METRKDMLFELKHKEKKISDIVRFLNIRCDDTPNYSLLIGAGCSVTSGIKSGSQLIDIWKKEIIENVDDYDKDSNIENYLENRIGMMKGIHILLFLKKGMICSGKEGHL